MPQLTQGVLLSCGLLVLFLIQLLAMALGQALRTYSPSRLKQLCEDAGTPQLAQEIALNDERAGRAAELTALVSGMFIAVLVFLWAATRMLTDYRSLLIISALVACAYLAADVFGRTYAEWILLRAWPFARLMRIATGPLAWTSRWLEARIARQSQRGAASPQRPPSVEVEILDSTHADETENLEASLSEPTRQQLENVVRLATRDISELITPISNVVMMPAGVSIAEAAACFLSSGFSRVPMYGEQRDDIVGILYAKDLLAALVDPNIAPGAAARTFAREPHLVPETKNAAAMLDEMLQSRVQIAIVVDEYGAVLGLLTLEDLLEEIVGPIHDEHDPPPAADTFQPVGDGAYELDASTSLEELNDRLGLQLPTEGDFQTVAGLALETLGRVPDVGATFQVAGVDFTVLEVANHAIRRVRVALRPQLETAAGS